MVYVLFTDHGDGSAKATVQHDGTDHRFSVSVDGDVATVQYEETQADGGFFVKAPPEPIWKELMQSDELTAYIDARDVESVIRDREE